MPHEQPHLIERDLIYSKYILKCTQGRFCTIYLSLNATNNTYDTAMQIAFNSIYKDLLLSSYFLLYKEIYDPVGVTLVTHLWDSHFEQHGGIQALKIS